MGILGDIAEFGINAIKDSCNDQSSKVFELDDTKVFTEFTSTNEKMNSTIVTEENIKYDKSNTDSLKSARAIYEERIKEIDSQIETNYKKRINLLESDIESVNNENEKIKKQYKNDMNKIEEEDEDDNSDDTDAFLTGVAIGTKLDEYQAARVKGEYMRSRFERFRKK